MIPKIIHYCWFGRGEMPELVQRCIASWHQYMRPTPDPSLKGRSDLGWKYMLWNEDNFDIATAPAYVQEAYEARKFAFVSDYVRLWALEQYGGLYMDVDFEVYKPFDDLMDCKEGAFIGREGSKHQPPMMGVMAAEPHHPWIQAMMETYKKRHFKMVHDEKQAYDLTPNVSYFATSGLHREEWVHIYPVEYFCPVLTTGEDVRNEHTYCEHKGLHSWGEKGGFKAKILKMVSPKMRTRLIKLKRKWFDE